MKLIYKVLIALFILAGGLSAANFLIPSKAPQATTSAVETAPVDPYGGVARVPFHGIGRSMDLRDSVGCQ